MSENTLHPDGTETDERRRHAELALLVAALGGGPGDPIEPDGADRRNAAPYPAKSGSGRPLRPDRRTNALPDSG
jgi:hypothetical protein